MIAVIGANGFLGHSIKTALLAEEGKGVFLTRSDWDILAPGAPPQLNEEIEAVINCADYYPGLQATAERPLEVWSQNVRIFERVFEFALVNDIPRVITIGTTACYPVSDQLLKEEWIEKGVDVSRLNQKMLPYAASRFALFNLASALAWQGVHHHHLILPNFYGPGDKFEVGRSHLLSSWIRDFSAAAEKGEEINLWGSPEAQREFIYIADAARATLELARRPLAKEIYNVGHSLAPTYQQLAEEICRAIDYPGHIHFDQTKVMARQREIMDISRASAEGFSLSNPTPLAIGLAATVRDFQERYRG